MIIAGRRIRRLRVGEWWVGWSVDLCVANTQVCMSDVWGCGSGGSNGSGPF